MGIAVLAEQIRWIIDGGSVRSKWRQGITIEHVMTGLVAEFAYI
jgi:hypothetical protein